MELDEAKRAVAAEVDRLAPDLLAMSREMYENPELGFQEVRAAGLLTGFLERAGFAVERGVAGLPTAFLASLQGSSAGGGRPAGRRPASGAEAGAGPTVAVLAEYDALPGVGHGCGHNIIGAAATGAGAALAPLVRAERVSGRLLVVGCPAEEGGVEGAGGKVILAEAGLFRGVDAAMMVHPGVSDAPSGRSNCRLALEITFRGKSAHAGGAPHEGINALEAVIQTFNAINALRQHLPEAVKVHGVVIKGGEAPSIVPDEGVVRLYVRAPSLAELEAAAERVRNCAKGGAMATGCQVDFREFARTYLDLDPSRPLEDLFAANMSALGHPYQVGGMPGRGTGSTDMGNVSHIVPSIHPYVGISERGAGVVSHSREFAKASVSRRGEEALLLAAKALAMTALDLLLDPGAMAAVRAAWRGPSGGRRPA